MSEAAHSQLTMLPLLKSLNHPALKSLTLSGLGKNTDAVTESALKAFPKIADLTIDGSVTNDTLKLLVGHANLNCVRLSSCEITKEGTKSLATIPRLESLSIDGVNDFALKELKDARNLKVLKAQGDINEQGIKDLATMKQLESLEVNGNFSGGSLKDLSSLTKLKNLCVKSPNELGSGLEHLTPLKELKRLHVVGPIKDGEIDALKNLPGLNKRYVDTTEFTAAGLDNLNNVLSNHLPNLKAFNYCPSANRSQPIMDARSRINETIGRRKISPMGF